MSMRPLLKYLLSIGHYLSGIFARQQDAPLVCGVCSGGRQFATPGDRIAKLFAAVHESAVGTFRTWRDVRLESVMRSRADMKNLRAAQRHQHFGHRGQSPA